MVGARSPKIKVFVLGGDLIMMAMGVVLGLLDCPITGTVKGILPGAPQVGFGSPHDEW